MKVGEILIQKLDTLIKLNALNIIERKTQKEQILSLSKVGFTPKEIADMIGTTSNTVSVSLNKSKKINKKRGKNEK